MAYETRQIDWFSAVQFSAFGVSGIFLFGSSWRALLVLALGLAVFTCAYTRRIRPALHLIRASALFVIPILLIHGVINPQFPITDTYWHVPLRFAGFAFGIAVALRVVVLFAVGIAWVNVDRDEFAQDMIALRIPLPALTLALQALAILTYMQRRAAAIYEAQQARGIDVSSTFLARARALPTILIPLFSATLSDAETRSIALSARGIGIVSPRPWTRFQLTYRRFVASGACAVLLLVGHLSR